MLFNKRKIEDKAIGMALRVIVGIIESGKISSGRFFELYNFLIERKRAINKSLISFMLKPKLSQRVLNNTWHYFHSELYLGRIPEERVYEALVLGDKYHKKSLRKTEISKWWFEHFEWAFDVYNFLEPNPFKFTFIGKRYIAYAWKKRKTWADKIHFACYYGWYIDDDMEENYTSEELNLGLNECMRIIKESRLDEYCINYADLVMSDSELIRKFDLIYEINRYLDFALERLRYHFAVNKENVRQTTEQLVELLNFYMYHTFEFDLYFSKIVYRARFEGDALAYDIACSYLDRGVVPNPRFYSYTLEHGIYPTKEMMEKWSDEL